MTTHQSLLHQRQDPQWAVACIEGLEGEVAKLHAQIKGIVVRYMVPRSRIKAIERETEEVEAKLADVQKNVRKEIERLLAKVEDMVARIEAAEKLPEFWHRLRDNLINADQLKPQDVFDECIADLQAALHPQEPSDG